VGTGGNGNNVSLDNDTEQTQDHWGAATRKRAQDTRGSLGGGCRYYTNKIKNKHGQRGGRGKRQMKERANKGRPRRRKGVVTTGESHVRRRRERKREKRRRL